MHQVKKFLLRPEIILTKREKTLFTGLHGFVQKGDKIMTELGVELSLS